MGIPLLPMLAGVGARAGAALKSSVKLGALATIIGGGWFLSRTPDEVDANTAPSGVSVRKPQSNISKGVDALQGIFESRTRQPTTYLEVVGNVDKGIEQGLQDEIKKVNLGLNRGTKTSDGLESVGGALTDHELTAVAGIMTARMRASYADGKLTQGEVLTSYIEGLRAGADKAQISPQTLAFVEEKVARTRQKFAEEGTDGKVVMGLNAASPFAGL